ncbi:unnamed protein product [Cylicostephanus goldi]|uniref:Uncharacterized protein n=1 Tax=Cylicostephanus goldi TaxID=71465 RepID=A0A3P6SV59_CYLGO|nr:unnamed protein product [Cylicostephanus goldi]
MGIQLLTQTGLQAFTQKLLQWDNCMGTPQEQDGVSTIGLHEQNGVGPTLHEHGEAISEAHPQLRFSRTATA